MNEQEDLTLFSSDRLAEIIVAYRYFGLNKELSILAMEELSRRRVNGDPYDFESFIDKSLKDLPVIDLKVESIDKILKSLKKVKNGF
jgi:hypothetical protein